MDEVAGYKVADLRQALKERGLPHTGTKNELVARLTAAMSTEKNSADDSVIDDSLLDEDSMLAGEDDESSAEDVTSDLENPTDNGLPETVPTAGGVAATGPGRMSPLKKQNGASSTNDDGESAAKKVKLNREPVQTIQASKVVAPTSPKKAITVVTTETIVSGTSDSTPKVPVKIEGVTILTAEERAKLREQKFGAASTGNSTEKKETRAARFGLKAEAGSKAKTPATPATPEDLERLEKRRQRFGLEETSKESIESARQKRAQRFGGAATTAAATPAAETDEKKQTRAARFGIS